MILIIEGSDTNILACYRDINSTVPLLLKLPFLVTELAGLVQPVQEIVIVVY